ESKYTNKLGMGYADASLTLEEFEMNTPASTPQFVTSETQSSYTSIQLGLTSSSITSENTFRYRIYYSTQPIISVDNNTDNILYRDIPAYYNISNNKLKVTIDELQPDKKYYFAVKTFARNGKASALIVYNGSIPTLANTAPEIIANKKVSQPFEVAGKDTLHLTFKIIDKENHTFTYEISKRTFIDIDQNKEEATVIVWAEKMFEGKNSFIITAKDELGALRTLEVFFMKKQDKAPSLNAFVRKIYLEKGEEKTIPLTSFIIDEDPQNVHIEIKNQLHNSVKAYIKDQMLTLKGQQFGESTLSLLLTDKHNQKSNIDITPYVYMNKGILSLFPSIANKNVYIKLGDKIQDTVKIEIRNSANKMVFEQSYNKSTINSSQNTLHINTSSFVPGRYQVVLKTNNQQYQEYFFKQ
ncbi:MAG: S8 family serine peptidase, partial [Prevotella sp.]